MSQQSLITRAPKFHKHYIVPGSVLTLKDIFYFSVCCSLSDDFNKKNSLFFTTKGTNLLDSGVHPLKTYQRPNHYATSDKSTKMHSGKESFVYYMEQKYD
jgi:hypothetical protein